MLERNKDLVRRFVGAGNAVDLEAFDEILAAAFVRHCQATPEVNVTDRDGFKRFIEETVVTFPDQHVEMDALVAEGDRVAFLGRFSGTQAGPMGPFPPSGKRLDVEMAGQFRIEDGKIAELWVIWDNVTGLMQLGHLPPPDAG